MTNCLTIAASSSTDRVTPRGGRHLSHMGVAFALGLAVALWPGRVAPAHAATFMVTTLADSGPGSLRQAIADANPGDTITFGPGASSGTITLTSGQLAVTKSLAIEGPGAASLTISGNSASRVFGVVAGATARIAGLTIVDGSASVKDGGVAGYFGGGVSNEGTLILDVVVVRDNIAAGIVNTGVLTITGSLISHNSGETTLPFAVPVATAGGIVNTGVLTLASSTVADNTAGTAPGYRYGNPPKGPDGGGIANGTGGVLTVVDSTIYGNKAGNGGYNDGGSVTGRAGAGGDGGGISDAASAVATIVDSTIVGNAAGNGATPGDQYDLPGAGGNGGGIYADVGTNGNLSTGGVTVTNSVVANNHPGAAGRPGPTGGDAPAGVGPDCNAIVSGGYTLVSDTSGCAISGDTTGDIVGRDPLLGPLQDNGGSTPTLLPYAGSPAIDQIPPDRCAAATDQRGQPRPADGGTGRAYCDIGAVEVNGAAPAPPPVTATPELGSGELLATGLLPLGLALLMHRRRARGARPR